jgi:hypothetical protein
MAKRKTVTHLPAPRPAAPRLAAQVLTVAGEFVIVAACVLGLVTAGSWPVTGYDMHGRAPRYTQQREVTWRCWNFLSYNQF